MSGQAKFSLENLLLEDIGARQRVLVRLQIFLQGCIHLDLDVHMQSGYSRLHKCYELQGWTLNKNQVPYNAQGQASTQPEANAHAAW